MQFLSKKNVFQIASLSIITNTLALSKISTQRWQSWQSCASCNPFNVLEKKRMFSRNSVNSWKFSHLYSSCRERLREDMLTRLNEMVLGTKQHYSRAVLMTLIASNSLCEEKIDILDRLESSKLSIYLMIANETRVPWVSVCVASVRRCARVLMLTAEFLALRAQGKGGLRSGPAANPSFTVVFESIKKVLPKHILC